MLKKIVYVLLPLQVIILLLSPRFGWKMHNPESYVLSYKGTTYADGKFHALYKNEDDKIDICYESIFSKQFLITINDTEEYEMKVEIDGNSKGAEGLLFTSNDLVWNDSVGIFGWRYILTIALTVISILLVKRTNCIVVFPCILYVVSILISLRILF